MVTLIKQSPLRLFGRRLIIAGLTMCVLFASWGVWGAFRKSADAARMKTEAERQLSELTTRRDALSAELSEMNSERGVEALIRQSYDVGEAGENMIVIVEKEHTVASSSQQSKQGWLRHILPW